MSDKPFCQAAEQNRLPILAMLQKVLPFSCRVFEVASGTGQHAVYFAGAMSDWQWQPSELSDRLAGLQMWLDEAQLPNIATPLELPVCDESVWDAVDTPVEAVFTCNTLHIFSPEEILCLFRGVAKILEPQGYFCVYGPFKYDGKHTAPSNQAFDEKLARENPHGGVRDVLQLTADAKVVGLQLESDIAMPCDNRLLVWRRA